MPAAVPCWANARFAGFALVCRHCGSVISPGRPPDPESERTQSSQKVITLSLEGEGMGEGVTPSPEVRKNADPD